MDSKATDKDKMEQKPKSIVLEVQSLRHSLKVTTKPQEEAKENKSDGKVRK